MWKAVREVVYWNQHIGRQWKEARLALCGTNARLCDSTNLTMLFWSKQHNYFRDITLLLWIQKGL